jgi:hypothetical protein
LRKKQSHEIALSAGNKRGKQRKQIALSFAFTLDEVQQIIKKKT